MSQFRDIYADIFEFHAELIEQMVLHHCGAEPSLHFTLQATIKKQV
jgi:hypothetical protein